MAESNLKKQQYSQQIYHKLDGVHFSYYTNSEIRQLSVKEIINPIAFDKLNQAILGGLYDPSLGVQPSDQLSKCVVCGQAPGSSSRQAAATGCPGHLGHIELILPLYNPFLISNLLRVINLLRSKCFYCHRLKIPERKLQNFAIMFLLTKLGYLTERSEYEKLCENRYYKQYLVDQKKDPLLEFDLESKTTGKSRADSMMTQQSNISEQTQKQRMMNKKYKKQTKQSANYVKEASNKSTLETDMAEAEVNAVLEKMQEYQNLVNLKNSKYDAAQYQNTNQINKVSKELIASFWSCVAGGSQKCPHCGKRNPVVSKEGYSKFFVTKTEQQVVVKGQQGQSKLVEDESELLELKEKNLHTKEKKVQQFLNPIEVKEHIQVLWQKERSIMNLIFGNLLVNKKTLESSDNGYELISNGPEMFFMEAVVVTPNRFRPENKLGDQTFLHGHTVILTKMLQLNGEIRDLLIHTKNNEEVIDDESQKNTLQQLKSQGQELLKRFQGQHLTKIIGKWIDLQDCLNCYYDATIGTKAGDSEGQGIKQLLEKKEGLFRMKIMGKRVNYSARSVISPDPNLATNELGVPLMIAKTLTISEPVNEYNIEFLRKLIENGPFEYPGAVSIQINKETINLKYRTIQQRKALAQTLLLSNETKVVQRQVINGDWCLFNRQPSLHKQSIMGFRVKVLKSDNTFRMHYANCSSFNADFDGDEMNMHLLQDFVSRNECRAIANSDFNYIVAKDGKPIRGLIQDSVTSSVRLTLRDTFFTRLQFQELVYISIGQLLPSSMKLEIPQPAIMKPCQLYSGKQLISCILQCLIKCNNQQQFSMTSTTKMNRNTLCGPSDMENIVTVHKGDLLTGVIDKNQIGNSEFGMIHSFYELYGPDCTGKLITALSRLFMSYLQLYSACTCSVGDLHLTEEGDQLRQKYISSTEMEVKEALRSYFKLSKELSTEELREQFTRLLSNPEKINDIDAVVKSTLNQTTTRIFGLISKLKSPFPENSFSAMVQSGAKGSLVNHNQVSLLLGQQELEGKRVPIMPSGRSLPSFPQGEIGARAGGFVGDRFLTGLRPQEFFFHCMAGREGLIDTAVKTSRSGYLQRCLIKNLENLIVSYDYTVRDSDKSIVQFYYGEDSIDPVKKAYLSQFPFLLENNSRYLQKFQTQEVGQVLESNTVRQYLKERKNNPEQAEADTLLNNYSPSKYFGAISEKYLKLISQFASNQYSKSDTENLFKKFNISQKRFFTLLSLKYFYSLVEPAHPVGLIAAESLGEPSTQMTLNTFHLAGHGGVNMTLGIPRLREILMTASENIKTPSMNIKLIDKDISKQNAEFLARKFQKTNILEIIQSLEVHEQILINKDEMPLLPSERKRLYKIIINFENPKAIKHIFGFSQDSLKKKIERIVIPTILNAIYKQSRKNDSGKQGISIQKHTGNDLLEKEALQSDIEVNELAQMNEDELEIYLQQFQNEQDESNSQTEENKTPKKSKKPEAKKQQSSIQQFITPQHASLFQGFRFENNQMELTLALPLSSKKMLMLNLIENILSKTIISEIKGISKTHVIKNKQEFIIQTEGINYPAFYNCSKIDHNSIYSNDISLILQLYGIEAARNCLISEISMVFNVYHISLDPRHFSLIADYMTQQGSIRPLNRIGIASAASPFLKMSFETTMQFLTNAALYREKEDNESLSSAIVLGRVPKVGTGMFDLRHRIK